MKDIDRRLPWMLAARVNRIINAPKGRKYFTRVKNNCMRCVRGHRYTCIIHHVDMQAVRTACCLAVVILLEHSREKVWEAGSRGPRIATRMNIRIVRTSHGRQPPQIIRRRIQIATVLSQGRSVFNSAPGLLLQGLQFPETNPERVQNSKVDIKL